MANASLLPVDQLYKDIYFLNEEGTNPANLLDDTIKFATRYNENYLKLNKSFERFAGRFAASKNHAIYVLIIILKFIQWLKD